MPGRWLCGKQTAVSAVVEIRLNLRRISYTAPWLSARKAGGILTLSASPLSPRIIKAAVKRLLLRIPLLGDKTIRRSSFVKVRPVCRLAGSRAIAPQSPGLDGGRAADYSFGTRGNTLCKGGMRSTDGGVLGGSPNKLRRRGGCSSSWPRPKLTAKGRTTPPNGKRNLLLTRWRLTCWPRFGSTRIWRHS